MEQNQNPDILIIQYMEDIRKLAIESRLPLSILALIHKDFVEQLETQSKQIFNEYKRQQQQENK